MSGLEVRSISSETTEEEIYPFAIAAGEMRKLTVARVSMNNGEWVDGNTIAGLWAGVPDKEIVALFSPIEQWLVGKSFTTPMDAWEQIQEFLATFVGKNGMTERGVGIAYAPYDLMLWDAWSRQDRYRRNPCQLARTFRRGEYADVLLPELRKWVKLLYTHGGNGNYLPHPEAPEGIVNGLIAFSKHEGRLGVKIKMGPDIDVNFQVIIAIHNLIQNWLNRRVKLWLDWNTSGSRESLIALLMILEEVAPEVLEDIVALEQPFSLEETMSASVVDIVETFGIPVFLDEAVAPGIVEQAMKLGNNGFVLKTGRWGFSGALKIAKEVNAHKGLISVQDLTLKSKAFWASMALAAYSADLYLDFVEGNRPQFFKEPSDIEVINGFVSTAHLTHPGW